MVDDALVGGFEEQALAATVVAARMALPGGEQVAERVHTIERLDAIPPVGPRRRRDERRDDRALPRLPLGVDPRFLALGAAPFAVLVIVVADARDPANHEDGDRAARKPACPAAPPAGVDAAKRPTSAEEQEQHAGSGHDVRPARHARVVHLETVVPRVRPAVVRLEVTDEAPLLPGLDAEDVILASGARWQRDRRRGRPGLLVHDHPTRA